MIKHKKYEKCNRELFKRKEFGYNGIEWSVFTDEEIVDIIEYIAKKKKII